MADGKVKKEKQYRDAKFPKGLKTVNAKEAAHYSGNQIYVKDIYIPASVERITKDAFTVLRGMTGSFFVDPDNPLYSSFGKAILSKNGKRFLHCVMSYKEGHNVIVIPDGVEIIEEYAFSCHGSYSFSLKFSTWSITSLNTSGVYWGGYPFLTRQILISCLS